MLSEFGKKKLTHIEYYEDATYLPQYSMDTSIGTIIIKHRACNSEACNPG